jgi:hypothetical protein
MRAIVSAPALRTHEHGLVSVGNVIQPGDDRWYDGINFTSRGCDVIFGHDTGCWSPRGNKSSQDCKALGVFTPYVIETSLSWMTGDLAADPKAMVSETLEVGTSAILERMIEMNLVDVADATPLTSPTVVGAVSATGIRGRVGVGGDVSVKLEDSVSMGVASTPARAALGYIEAKLLDASDHTGGAGVIYVSPLYVPFLRDALTYADGQLYTTATGSKVVVGNFAANAIYGHVGDVDVYLGDIIINEFVQRGANEYFVQAERVVAAVWNPCGAFRQTIDNTLTFAS